MALANLPSRPMSQSSPQLPGSFLDYMLNVDTGNDRPTKRRKLGASDSTRNQNTTGDSNFIVVSRSGWKSNYSFSGLPLTNEPLRRSKVLFHTSKGRNADLPKTLDILRKSKELLLSIPTPSDTKKSEDIYIALLLHQDILKWDGSLRTECDLTLLSKDGSLILEVELTLKWKTTSSVNGICPKTTKPDALQKILVKYFADASVNTADRWTPQDFYQAVHAPVKSHECDELRVPGLASNLFPFQKRAVQWLLGRESMQWTSSGLIKYQRTIVDLPMSFRRARDVDGKDFYISRLFGLVTLDITPFMALEQTLQGGILSEEMGLGKTVEMISLISLHRQVPTTTSAMVHDSWTGTKVRSTGATLIITPPSILKQWISEVEKHAPSLDIVHYEGVKKWNSRKTGGDPSDLLHQLASADIVVTTYAVLGAEIYYTSLNGKKSLRTQSKYPRPQSPLMQLQW